MKRFRFSLEQALAWRIGQAHAEEAKMQRLYSEMESLERRKRDLERRRQEEEQAVAGRPSIEAIELGRLDSFSVYVRRSAATLDESGARCRMEIAAQRERLLEARRRSELLQTLRRKALAQWQAASNKEQEDLASELFLARFNRERE
jgi:hypothetical protein